MGMKRAPVCGEDSGVLDSTPTVCELLSNSDVEMLALPVVIVSP